MPTDIKMKFSDQVKIRLISQLINDILRVFQKLLRYFSGAYISVFFVSLSLALPIIYFLYLNEGLVSSLTRQLIILPLSSKSG